MRTDARFPDIASDAGHYESFYLKATRPGGGRAAWLRHTIHKRPGASPTASLWLTLFDADSAGPRAGKQTFASGELSVPPGAYVAVGPAVLEPGRAVGALLCDSLSATWNLAFEDESDPLFHLPYERLYERLDDLRAQFAAADPFPHIVIDEFLAPELIDEIIREFPAVSSGAWIHYVHFNERKYGKTDRASFGSREPPNRTSTMTRITTSSAGPMAPMPRTAMRTGAS